MALGPLVPGMSFGRRYHIKRLLGLGGWARSTRPGTPSWASTSRSSSSGPDIIGDPAAAAEIQRRFKRELLLARLVSHQNVVRIHDLGEIEGLKYITMSYVDGTDLASLLAREGRLPVKRALRLARRICAGLVAAHAAGVVHRDLKPANVMVGSGDEALITDFGIARLLGSPEADGGSAVALPSPSPLDLHHANVTQAGSMVGTLEYMPPEQARGEQVDQRADVYALGLMLHDMLSGRIRQTRSPSALDELKSRGDRPPAPLHGEIPEVSEALDQIIARCTDPSPSRRYRSSAELAEALARLDDEGRPLRTQRTVGVRRVSIAAVVVLGTIGVAWWYNRPRPPPVAHAPVSVVISDFANGTGDTGLDRTLEPVIKLSLESAPFITAYAHSDVRRALNVDPQDPFDERAANELAVKQGLGVVVAGSIDRADQGYRLRATARQAVTGKVVARAEREASSRDGVLAAVGRLSEEIRQRLGDESSDAEQRFAMDTLTATSLDVVHDYAVAMEALSSSQFEAARASFQRAVERDPAFGLAYAGRAIASANLGKQQEAQKDITEAVRHVDRMTERERFRARGLYYYLTADYPSCVKEYGALVSRYKSDAAAHNNRALCLTRLREMPQALDEMREVVTILPNRALYRVNLALYAAYATDFATAQTEALRGAADEPAREPAAGVRPARAGAARRCAEDLGGAGKGEPGRRLLRRLGSGRPRHLLRPLLRGDPHPGGRGRGGPRCRKPGPGRRQAGGHRLRRALPRTERRCRRRRGPGHRRERDDEGPLPRRPHLRAHRRDRGGALHRGGAVERAPRRARAHAKVLEAELALSAGDPRRAISLARGSERTARHLDRPVRARPGVPGRGRLRAGGLRARPLLRPARRGARALPRRGAHLRHRRRCSTTPRAGSARASARRASPRPTSATWTGAAPPARTRSSPRSGKRISARAGAVLAVADSARGQGREVGRAALLACSCSPASACIPAWQRWPRRTR